MLKNLFCTCCLLISASAVFSQSTVLASNGSARYGAATTFLQDYQTVGINPANLGIWNSETKMITLGTAEFSVQLHSNALTRKDIFQKVLTSHTLTDSEKTLAVKDFIYHPVSASLDVLGLGVSVQLPKLGGFGFTLRQHAAMDYQFNPFVSNLLFHGIYDSSYFNHIVQDSMHHLIAVSDTPQYISKLFAGTSMSYVWYQEYNLSYGRKIFEKSIFKLYAGIGIKYLQGFGIMDAEFKDGNISGFTANSPVLKIDYSGLNVENAVAGNGLKAVGTGTGFDFGLTARIINIIKVGIAVTDVGSITWTGNMLQIKDSKLDSLKTFSGVSTLSPADMVKAFNNTKEFISWEEGVKRTIALPAKLRFGASANLGKIIQAGFDVVEPLNSNPGNFEKAQFALGLDIQPVPTLCFSTGFITGGNTDFDVPFGIALNVGPKQLYQFGISVSDIMTFFQSDKPTLGLSLGFLRFQF